MRIAPKPTEQEIIEGPQAVSFQIANGNARQSCFCKPSFQPRRWPRSSLTNWPAIERMAREALATGILEDGQIKLVGLSNSFNRERQFWVCRSSHAERPREYSERAP